MCYSLRTAGAALTLVAEDRERPSNHTMSMIRITKVPTMSTNQPYCDWKKELEVWRVANNILQVDKQIQAATLFASLEGSPRQTVLSELAVDQITAEDGVENIIQILDNFFLGNETQSAYSAIDNLLRYKCSKGDTMENFIVQFNLKVNKVKSSGTVLPDGVLGYTLLNSANLPEEKHDMVKATCDVLTFKNVKAQLEKVGFTKSNSQNSKFSTAANLGASDIKLESCYYGNLNHQNYCEFGEGSSSADEDLNGEKVYFSERKTPNINVNNASQGSAKLKLNPTYRFGHVRPCTFCKCLYHWLVDCPYAPVSVKNNIRAKERSSRSNKPL